MLYKLVLAFQSVAEILSVTIEMKAFEQNARTVLHVCRA